MILLNETEVKIPENINVIGYGAFENCSYITHVNIPMGVTKIDTSAFAGCKGLVEIILPESLTSIYPSAFYNCSNLAEINIPKSTNYIGPHAFDGTKWLKEYEGDFVILDDVLITYKGKDSKITIPDNITTICTYAFNLYNYINEVIIPVNVRIIRYSGFNYCENLQKVTFLDVNINLEAGAFNNNSKNLEFYSTSSGLVESYAKKNNITFIKYGLNKSKVTLYLGGDSTTGLSIGNMEGKYQWESEDPTIAKVKSNGKVTALKVGSTKIYAKYDDLTLSCDITVKNPYISKSSLTLAVGKNTRLNIVGVSSKVTWTTSDKSIATVDKSGIITAKKKGTVTITGKVNGTKYVCKVKVK